MQTPHYHMGLKDELCHLCGEGSQFGKHLPEDDNPLPLAMRHDRVTVFLSEHDYVSTACQHRLHERCRQTCKFCFATCQCVCHRWKIAVESE